MSEISLKKYALDHGIDSSTARQRALRGAFKTAHKVGRDWVIDENEPLVDHRSSKAEDSKILYCYAVIADLNGNNITIDNVFGENSQAVVDSIRDAFPEYNILKVFKEVNDWK